MYIPEQRHPDHCRQCNQGEHDDGGEIDFCSNPRVIGRYLLHTHPPVIVKPDVVEYHVRKNGLILTNGVRHFQDKNSYTISENQATVQNEINEIEVYENRYGRS